MRISFKSYSSKSSLISSIIFLLFGIVLFISPESIIKMISWIIGGLLSAGGLFDITLFIRRKKNNIEALSSDLAIGVILLTIGLLFIFLAGAIETAIRIIIGAWILLSGINKLVSTFSDGRNSSKYSSKLIVSFLIIFIGVYIILVSNLVISGIGLVIIIYSIVEIIAYIVSTNDTVEEKKDIELIVPEKEETKDEVKSKKSTKKIKEVKVKKEKK